MSDPPPPVSVSQLARDGQDWHLVLDQIRQRRQQLDHDTREGILSATDAGVSVSAVARGLGITRQAAQQRLAVLRASS